LTKVGDYWLGGSDCGKLVVIKESVFELKKSLEEFSEDGVLEESETSFDLQIKSSTNL
jgi:hypothetical protein